MIKKNGKEIQSYQLDKHIMNYVNAAGIDNKAHWVEPNLPDLERDLKEEVGIEFD